MCNIDEYMRQNIVCGQKQNSKFAMTTDVAWRWPLLYQKEAKMTVYDPMGWVTLTIAVAVATILLVFV